MSTDTIIGIPRVDLRARPVWKRNLSWALGGPLFASKKGFAMWARFVAPIEAPLIQATSGRVRLNIAIHFTDGGDVMLIASNYGGGRHPAWYHNLVAHPECELHIGRRGGAFMAREVHGPERDRLYALAAEHLAKVFALHEMRSGARRI